MEMYFDAVCLDGSMCSTRKDSSGFTMNVSSRFVIEAAARESDSKYCATCAFQKRRMEHTSFVCMLYTRHTHKHINLMYEPPNEYTHNIYVIWCMYTICVIYAFFDVCAYDEYVYTYSAYSQCIYTMTWSIKVVYILHESATQCSYASDKLPDVYPTIKFNIYCIIRYSSWMPLLRHQYICTWNTYCSRTSWKQVR